MTALKNILCCKNRHGYGSCPKIYRLNSLLFLAIVGLSIGGARAQDGDTTTWIKNFWQNPQHYLADDYERSIFQKFTKKFPGAALRNISRKPAGVQRENLIVQLKLSAYVPDYYLLIEKSALAGEVQRVYRYLPQLQDYADENVAGVNLQKEYQWLGKLLYRVDAGDSAAILDLIFYKDIKISYNRLTSKAEIAAALIRDYSKVVDVRQVDIKSHQQRLQVELQTQNFNGILLDLPDKFTENRNTDALQNELYQKFTTILRHPAGSTRLPPALREDPLRRFPGSIIDGNSLKIPYLEKKVAGLPAMHFLLSTSGAMTPQINLKVHSSGIVAMNDGLKIPFYGNLGNPRQDLQRLQASLAAIYKLFTNYPLENNLRKDLSVTMRYRAYRPHEMPDIGGDGWAALLAHLEQQHTLYFYPSRIDLRGGKLRINGLFYAISRSSGSYYHFAELSVNWRHNTPGKMNDIQLTFYPYVQNNDPGVAGGSF